MSGDLFDWTPPPRNGPPPPAEVPYDVAMLFEKLAFDISDKGLRKYSARAILYRIRWHHEVERGDRAFKCNDHWSPLLARWLIKKYPAFDGFFELRERTGAESEWVDA